MTSLTVLFGNPPIERVLFSSGGAQSQKVLDVWLSHEPLPTVADFLDFAVRAITGSDDGPAEYPYECLLVIARRRTRWASVTPPSPHDPARR